MNVNNVFTTVIIVQIFFAVGMTGMSYYMPSDAISYLSDYTAFAQKTGLEDLNDKVHANLESQTNIPVIELGALIFYTGNILLDLILNFVFAIPEMITLLIHVVLSIISIPAEMAILVKLFAGVTTSVIYLIGVIQFLASMRSGRFT